MSILISKFLRLFFIVLVNHNELLIVFRGSTGVMERENFSKSNTAHHKDGDRDWKQ